MMNKLNGEKSIKRRGSRETTPNEEISVKVNIKPGDKQEKQIFKSRIDLKDNACCSSTLIPSSPYSLQSLERLVFSRI